MRYRAVVAYDGTAYQGWQAQPSGPTVQQTIEAALTTVLREPIRIVAAGRTDAGVHARGQVIAFDATIALDPHDDARFDRTRPSLARTLRSVNAVLPEDVALQSLDIADPEFDPRHDAIARGYR